LDIDRAKDLTVNIEPRRRIVGGVSAIT